MAAAYRIKTKTESGKGTSWPITEKPLIIGREKGCDLRIADPLVSRHHCEIMLVGDEVHLRDLGSRNYTLVNGKQVQECVLQAGDEINVGQVTFVLTFGSSRMSGSPHVTSGNTTVTLSEGEVVFLSSSALKDFEKSGFTVSDVLQLFRAGRTFSHATSVDMLIETLD